MLKKYIALFFICLALSACARKPAPTPSPAPESQLEIQDIKNFPQNLEVYAAQAGADRRLVSAQVQEEMFHKFINIFFGPWSARKTSIRKGEVSSLFGRARGWKNSSDVWTQAEWDAMRANADLASFPNRNRSAITLRDTDLRELPTHTPRFTEPTPHVKDNPFDYFQYSLLSAGMPLLIAHTSLDGRWHYVECPIAGGWVDAADVAYVDDAFKSLWRGGRYTALIKDKVILPGTGPDGKDSLAGIGTVLPAASGWTNSSPKVLLPVKGRNGFADSAEADLAPGSAVIMPMALTPANAAKVGNVMMGQSYGWGGMLGLRDCSAMTRDILTPFGVWLPRNSAAQARRGSVIPLTGMSAAEKESVILRSGVPFLSLVGLKGHIALYVGKWKGKPAIFHNTWGVRIVKNGDDNERFVIGRAVVTSISPGIELQNLYRPKTFVDRLRALTAPPY